ncbi:MAG: hypothetical protein ACPGSM_18765, partial [Thiolinea sp.]
NCFRGRPIYLWFFPALMLFSRFNGLLKKPGESLNFVEISGFSVALWLFFQVMTLYVLVDFHCIK